MSTKRKFPKKKPSTKRQVTFLVSAADLAGEDDAETTLFTKEAADSIVGKYTMFQGVYETQVLHAEVTDDLMYIKVTVAVPNKILKELGL